MRKEYDFSKAKRNPYAKRLKRQITIRLDEPTIEYFKRLAEETGIPYQTLINLYLRDCASRQRKLSMRPKLRLRHPNLRPLPLRRPLLHQHRWPRQATHPVAASCRRSFASSPQTTASTSQWCQAPVTVVGSRARTSRHSSLPVRLQRPPLR